MEFLATAMSCKTTNSDVENPFDDPHTDQPLSS